MKRKNLVRMHVIASIIGFITILCFSVSSLVAEINGDEQIIRSVKTAILFSLPVLCVAMPMLGISGDKLSGSSKNLVVLKKKFRMKIILINGLLLIALASLLYYRVHHYSIDRVFVALQTIESVLGLINLSLMVMNIRSGFILSGRIKPT